jgi:hypothetical protein
LRAIETPAGRGRVVLLPVTPGGDPSELLRLARDRPSERVRYVVVPADPIGPEALASRILSDPCGGSPPAPCALLRAWLAHLASRGGELAVGLDEPGRLSLDTASWLGRMVRASRGAMRIVVPWANDPRIWRVIEALGLETEVVPTTGAPARGERTATPELLEPATASVPPPAAPSRRPSARTRALLAVGGLAGLALLAAALWWTAPRDPLVARDGRSPATPAPPSRVGAPTVARPAPVIAEPAGHFAFDPRTGLLSIHVREEPLDGLLAELSQQLGFELRNLSSEPLSQRVTLSLEQVPLSRHCGRCCAAIRRPSSTPATRPRRVRPG